MSDILEKAKEHFKAIDRKIIDVPEWGITVYAKPLTLADKRILTRNTKPDDVTLFADVLILKAEDKEGKKLYSLEDKQTLMRSVDPEVVARVAQDILSVVPVEDWLKKNQDWPRTFKYPTSCQRPELETIRHNGYECEWV